jgi:hypothetical protein
LRGSDLLQRRAVRSKTSISQWIQHGGFDDDIGLRGNHRDVTFLIIIGTDQHGRWSGEYAGPVHTESNYADTVAKIRAASTQPAA